MAEIPIEKKESGSNVWPWVLAALLIAGAVVAWVVLSDDDTEVQPQETAAVQTQNEQETRPGQEMNVEGLRGPITSATVLGEISPEALDGKELRLDKLQVTRVLGDRIFYVTTEPPGERQFLVILDDQRADGERRVRTGQTLSIQGTVEKMQDFDASRLEVTEQEAQAMKGDQLYLRAQNMQVES